MKRKLERERERERQSFTLGVERVREIQTDRRTYIHTYIHTYIQTDRQTDNEVYRTEVGGLLIKATKK